MTTAQMIMLSTGAITAIIGWVGSCLIERFSTRIFFHFLLFLTCTYLFLIALVSTQEMNKWRNEAKGVCPEYELINNVYKLKK
jgi:hypothetical protein